MPTASARFRLSLLLPVCLSPRYVPRFDFEREFPQGLLGQMVAEVVEERDDVVVPLDLVMPAEKGGRPLHRGLQNYAWGGERASLV